MNMNHCRIAGRRRACYSMTWQNDSTAAQCWKVDGKQIGDAFTLYPGEKRYWIVDTSARITVSVQFGKDWFAEATGSMSYCTDTKSWTFRTEDNAIWTFEQWPGSVSLVCRGGELPVHEIADHTAASL